MTTDQENVLLVDAAGGARLLGISRTSFYALHSSGDLGPLPVQLGRKRLARWRADELRAWTWADCPPRTEWLKQRTEWLKREPR